MLAKNLRLGKATLVLNMDEDLDRLGEWLLGVLMRMHEGGAIFENGSHIQLGWSFLVLIEEKPDYFVVCEPDFAGNPFADRVANVSITLRMQARLNDFAADLSVEPIFPSFQDKIVLQKGSLSLDNLFMNRSNPQEGDSGWFIGAREEFAQSEELAAIYVFELLRIRPQLFPALALPPGYVVVADSEGIEAVLDADDKVVFKR